MRISKPLLYTLFLVVAVAAYLLLTGERPKSTSGKKPSTAAKKPSQSDQFTAEDFKAKYPSLDGAAQNAFMPVAGRVNNAPGSGTRTDAIPAAFAGNEPNWIYTGTAEIDGVPVALFESTANREGVFLKQGEHWKGSSVMQIGPDFVVLAAQDGATYRVSLAPYDLAVEAGPLDVSSAARAAMTPRVIVTPQAGAPANPSNLTERTGD